jgi:hypothetical protein
LELQLVEPGGTVVDAVDDPLLERIERRLEDDPAFAMGAGEAGELDIGRHLVAAERDRRQGRLVRIGGSAGLIGCAASAEKHEQRQSESGAHATMNAGRLIQSPAAD